MIMNDDSVLRFELATCIFHKNSHSQKLFDRPDWLYGIRGQFAWYRCPECGLRYLNPRPTPDSIVDYYPDDYAPYRMAIDDEPLAIMRWKRRLNLRKQLKVIVENSAPGRLLDIGCATGNFLALMRQHGWQVQGIELQAEAARYARDRLGLEVFTGDLLDCHLPDDSFEAITMWDVLEHTFDPMAILTEVRRLLRPGGVLAFSIPNLDSKDASRFGPAWIGYDSPRHLYVFSGTSISSLLEVCGFEHLRNEYFLGTYHTWIASFHTELNRSGRRRVMRKCLLKLAYLPFWAALTAPYFHWLNRRKCGAVVTVIARAAGTNS